MSKNNIIMEKIKFKFHKLTHHKNPDHNNHNTREKSNSDTLSNSLGKLKEEVKNKPGHKSDTDFFKKHSVSDKETKENEIKTDNLFKVIKELEEQKHETSGSFFSIHRKRGSDTLNNSQVLSFMDKIKDKDAGNRDTIYQSMPKPSTDGKKNKYAPKKTKEEDLSLISAFNKIEEDLKKDIEKDLENDLEGSTIRALERINLMEELNNNSSSPPSQKQIEVDLNSSLSIIDVLQKMQVDFNNDSSIISALIQIEKDGDQKLLAEDNYLDG